VKIGPVDTTEIALLIVKEETNASKIFSPTGKFAERVKKQSIDQTLTNVQFTTSVQ